MALGPGGLDDVTRLTVVRAVPLPPEEVARAYRRWVLGGAGRGEEGTRTAREVDPTHLRFSRTGRAGAGRVRVEGFVSFDSPTSWDCRREIELEGQPYAREIERYHVAARTGGSELTVDFEIHARSTLHEFLLGFGRGRLLVRRTRALDEWLPAR